MQQDNRQFLLATIISIFILILWNWLYKDTTQTTIKNTNIYNEESIQNKKTQNSNNKIIKLIDRNISIENSKKDRVQIVNDNIKGSINLKGAKFDDLILLKYYKTINKKDNIILLSPSSSKTRYTADFGWISSDKSIKTPNQNTLWKTNKQTLTPETPITLKWSNEQNIFFYITIEIDEHYMFYITQSIKNMSGKPINISSYGRINRILEDSKTSNFILHEGGIGVFDKVLKEITYKELKEGHNNISANNGWLGITDKYWLTSLIPDNNTSFLSNFYHKTINKKDIYNTEFISEEFVIENEKLLTFKHKLFSGAKQVSLLDSYSKEYNITLFDRAVDFGWYYFLTKPFYFILKFLNSILGNYGLAIIFMTILIKIVMFPLANKSYKAMGSIKKLQPQMEEIRKKNKNNKMQINKEIMDLYKKNNTNPASGCLPIIIQIPVFFSLYKVLFVTIDMRHAPFYGWIKDLSAPDPTSIFNLFGILPFEVESSILLIGVWPILMGLTMMIQQRLNPQIGDPTQAKIIKILPFVLIFIFASFPAGLLIYWTWNNVLSTIQQWFITRNK